MSARRFEQIEEASVSSEHWTAFCGFADESRSLGPSRLFVCICIDCMHNKTNCTLEGIAQRKEITIKNYLIFFSGVCRCASLLCFSALPLPFVYLCFRFSFIFLQSLYHARAHVSVCVLPALRLHFQFFATIKRWKRRRPRRQRWRKEHAREKERNVPQISTRHSLNTRMMPYRNHNYK